MKQWKNLLLVKKLAISYGLILLVFLTFGWIMIITLHGYKANVNKTTYYYYPLVEHTTSIERLTQQALYAFNDFIQTGNDSSLQLIRSRFLQLENVLNETQNLLLNNLSESELEERIQIIEYLVDTLKLSVDESAMMQREIVNIQSRIRINQYQADSVIQKFLSTSVSTLWNNLASNILIKEKKSLLRKNQIMNRYGTLMNNNALLAFQSISSRNPESLKRIGRNNRYLDHFSKIIDTLMMSEEETSQISILRQSRTELNSLINTLNRILTENNRLSIENRRISYAVIKLSTEIREASLNLSKVSISDNYRNMERIISIFGISLLVFFVLAALFAFLITKSITVPISQSVQFAKEIASGNLNSHVEINQTDEVGILAKTMLEMQFKLSEYLTNLKTAERNILSLTIETEQRERKRFSEDIHDSLGPLLSTTKLYINALRDADLSPEKKYLFLENANKLLLEAISTTRNISYNLQPSQLSDFGLDVAFRSYCNRINDLGKLRIEYNVENYQSLSKHAETLLFAVLKELVNNAVKHADAKTVIIRLFSDNSGLKIDYEDDGRGFNFDTIDQSEHYGILNISNRLSYLNGRVEYDTAPGEGTRIKIEVPQGNLTETGKHEATN